MKHKIRIKYGISFCTFHLSVMWSIPFCEKLLNINMSYIELMYVLLKKSIL